MSKCPHLKITFTFPIRGHSFLPADRVFGRIEQDIRRHPTILMPREYITLIKRHGHVHEYLKDWQSCDFKAAASKFVKKTNTFKISTVKVLEMKGSAVGVKDTYSADFTLHPILKKGYRWDNFHPERLPPTSHVKPAKRTDTLKLLMELKPPQDVLEYYNEILGAETNSASTTNSSGDDSDSD